MKQEKNKNKKKTKKPEEKTFLSPAILSPRKILHLSKRDSKVAKLFTRHVHPLPRPKISDLLYIEHDVVSRRALLLYRRRYCSIVLPDTTRACNRCRASSSIGSYDVDGTLADAFTHDFSMY